MTLAARSPFRENLIKKSLRRSPKSVYTSHNSRIRAGKSTYYVCREHVLGQFAARAFAMLGEQGFWTSSSNLFSNMGLITEKAENCCMTQHSCPLLIKAANGDPSGSHLPAYVDTRYRYALAKQTIDIVQPNFVISI